MSDIVHCTVNSDCTLHYGILSHCANTTCVAGKTLFQPLLWQEIALPIYSAVAQLFAASTGLGGGVLLQPVYSAAGISAATASALSTSCIFGAAIANFLILSLRKHPTRKRPLIHYDITVLVEPIILVGVTMGVFLNVMLPAWSILVISFVILMYLDLRTWKKGIKQFIAEVKAKRQKKNNQHEAINSPDEEEDVDSREEAFLQNQMTVEKAASDEDRNSEHYSPNETELPPFTRVEEDPQLTEQDKKKLNLIKKSEGFQLPVFKLVLLVFAWVVIFLSSLFRGSKNSKSIVGIETCDALYWILTVAIIPPLLILTCSYALFLRLFHRLKQRLHYDFAKGDVQWSTLRAFFVPILFLSAGILASLLGIGGGAIAVPIMLDVLHLPADVAVATSAFMILFTSSSSSAQYIFFGLLPWDYALLFAGFGFIGGFAGTIGMGYIMRKTGMKSLVVLLLAALMLVGILVSAISGVIKIIQRATKGEEEWGFKNFCD